MKYVCDQCGACCRNLIIEAELEDVLREPRIASECKLLNGNGKLRIIESQYMIACGKTAPCPFDVITESGGSQCSIYPTRPNVCVGFVAGSQKCQESRERSGLPPLAMVEGDDELQAAILDWQRECDEAESPE